MAQMNLPAAPNYRRTSYSGLLGCDFSVDPSLVNKRRSPDCLNMISDEGGNPIKRKGWEVVNNSRSGRIENIWSFFENQRYIVYTCKTGNNTAELVLINESGEEIELKQGGVVIKAGKHCAFYTNTSNSQYGFYIIDGEKYHRIYYDEGIHYEEVDPHVPLFIIAREPNGGGEIYEEINLLTRQRKEQFINTEDNKTFVVSSAIDTNKPLLFEYLGNDGEWHTDSSATPNGSTVTVNTVHYLHKNSDDIRITYYATGDDKSSYILQCEACAHFSATIQDQIFLTANPNRHNHVYYSAQNDISYFPDTNYLNIGGENEIMGFLNFGEYLAVIKESATNDSSIFLIYPTSISSKTVSSEDGKTTTTQERTFAVKRSIAGIGAISKYAFAVLNDEPLFLSSLGVYGVISSNMASEKIVRNRSFMVDQKLTKENLKNSIATVWNNYYVISAGGEETKQDYVRDNNGDIVYETVTKTIVDTYTGESLDYEEEAPKMQTVSAGRMYLLDGRHKTSNNAGNTNYGYESYYWEGIPAICLASYEKELWFGTADGRVCRFKNNGEDTDYSDGTDMSDETVEGIPIVARWSTPNDNDGMTEYFKTMMKKGTMCTVSPYTSSSVKVYISVDGYPRKFIGKYYADITTLFDGEIDFSKLSFDASVAPKDRFFRKKQKKYKRLQIILENDAPNQAFGVFEIVKTYVYQRYAK